jgi:hypothetical protein
MTPAARLFAAYEAAGLNPRTDCVYCWAARQYGELSKIASELADDVARALGSPPLGMCAGCYERARGR